jgi:(1->4)-alpha-D-glucan 1-alpha-D-glucosylmutase
MPRSVPLATYRLQFSAAFKFADAAALVPYLRSLGISHLYASPFLKSRPGSTHGYDIVDHNALDPELGGDAGFAELSAALAEADMGLILDFVPNHMGIGYADNAWWLDVLEYGPASPYAESFDIDWDLLPFRTHAGVLLPILGRPYGQALEDGEIALRFDPNEGSFSAWYFKHRLPIRPDRYADIVTTALRAAGGEGTKAGRELLAIVKDRAPTRRDAPAFKAALAAVDGGAELIEAGLPVYRPSKGDPRKVAALHRLLERQHYRVAHWRVAVSDINYRRFFDINDLAGIRVERTRTFRAVHQLVFRLATEGRLHGIRLDHIDGLYDPSLYCRQLRHGLRTSRNGGGNGGRFEFYTVIEKILAEGESLPRLAGIAGTTGYDTLNDLTHLLLDPQGLPLLERTLAEATSGGADFSAMLTDSKRLVINSILASEFRVLVQLLARIAAGHWASRDFTVDRLQAALESYVIHFPVYRTYLTGQVVSEQDRAVIAGAIAGAQSHWTGPDKEIFQFLQDVLTLDLVRQERSGYSHARVRRFTMKLQQFTGPVMAKAMEDTAFYRYHRLLALNEVGGEPTAPGLGIAEFHARMAVRMQREPHAMTATATHDTKRGEDARMRILALAELADDWNAAVRQWMADHERMVEQGSDPSPSRGHRYMLYQALLGAWPLAGADDAFADRMTAYALKAAREGKLETSWANPDAEYESALASYIKAILDPAASAEFLRSFSEFARRTALIGALNSLSQLTLKLTLPGVPDLYQGTEFWDLSLVDPDNRRAVDFGKRRSALSVIGASPDWRELCAQWPDGRLKMVLLRRLLELRGRHGDLFDKGRYEGLPVSGPDRDRIVAFARTSRRQCVVVLAARHTGGATGGGRRWPQPGSFNAAVTLPPRFRFTDFLEDRRDDLRTASQAASTAMLSGLLPARILVGD